MTRLALLAAIAVAAAASALTAEAAAVERAAIMAPITLRLPIPPPDAFSLAVFRVSGKLRPGATLPVHADLSTLLPIVNPSHLPRTVAVYGAERVAKSGQDVTLVIGIVALRSAAPMTTSSALIDFPPVSDKAKDDVALAFAAGFQGNFFALSSQQKAEDEFEFQMDPKGQARFYEANDLIQPTSRSTDRPICLRSRCSTSSSNSDTTEAGRTVTTSVGRRSDHLRGLQAQRPY